MTKAVIFDIDGTLLDSVDLHARAWQETLEHFGYPVSFDQIRSQIGKGGDQLLPEFLGKDDLERDQKKIQEFRAKLFKDKYLSQVTAFPGVRQLFEKVLSNGQRVGLASSAKGDELKHYEQIANIEDLVQQETSSADAERSKPHPDIFEVAVERLGPDLSRDEIIVVGDSPYDAEAGKGAGLRTVGVLCGGFPEQTLREAGCIEIYEGPADLLRRYDQSPLAAGVAIAAGGRPS